MYLTLLPEDYEAEPLRALTLDLLQGQTPAEIAECLTPYGPNGFIEGDLVDDSEAVDGDESVGATGYFSCDPLWVEDNEE